MTPPHAREAPGSLPEPLAVRDGLEPIGVIEERALRAFLLTAQLATIKELLDIGDDRTYERGCLDGQLQTLEHVARYLGRSAGQDPK